MTARVILWALVLLLPACGRCSGSTAGAPDASADAEAKVMHVDVLPPPAKWTFEPVRIGPTFPGAPLPSGCSNREPILHAKVPTSTRFVATPGALGTLVIADADATESPPRLTGVAAMDLNLAGTNPNPIALPWVDAGMMPRMARTSAGTWLAAYAEPAAGKLSEVFLFHNGASHSLGEGDKFEAIDLSCNQSTCLLLTTRFGQVSGAGADVWFGKPDASAESWNRQEIVPVDGESDARPTCIAGIDVATSAADGGAEQDAVVALSEGTDLAFWSVGPAGNPRELGKVSTPHGIIDAAMLGRPVALAYGASVDDEGCAQLGGLMRIERVGASDIEIRSPAPPTSGAIRRLTRGGLATYIAPLGCGMTRKVVYSVVLDDDGKPASAPMPISDATSFAVTTDGEKADFWIQREDEVVWIRARCSAP